MSRPLTCGTSWVSLTWNHLTRLCEVILYVMCHESLEACIPYWIFECPVDLTSRSTLPGHLDFWPTVIRDSQMPESHDLVEARMRNSSERMYSFRFNLSSLEGTRYVRARSDRFTHYSPRIFSSSEGQISWITLRFAPWRASEWAPSWSLDYFHKN